MHPARLRPPAPAKAQLAVALIDAVAQEMKITFVEMFKFYAGDDADIVVTDGLGPCIAVAIGYGAYGFLSHSPEHHGTLDDFLSAVTVRIPHGKRASIHPVLAGGALEQYPPGFPENEIQKDTESDRTLVISRLVEEGFGESRLCWNVAGASQSVFLHRQKKTIVVEPFGDSVARFHYE